MTADVLGTSEVNENCSFSHFQRSFLGYASFKVGELLRSKEQLLALSLRWVSLSAIIRLQGLA